MWTGLGIDVFGYVQIIFINNFSWISRRIILLKISVLSLMLITSNSATDFNGYCSRTNSQLMLARVWSASIVGIDALKVGVEIDVSGCREL